MIFIIASFDIRLNISVYFYHIFYAISSNFMFILCFRVVYHVHSLSLFIILDSVAII